MSISLAQRLQDAVKHLAVVKSIIEGPASGEGSLITLPGGGQVKTLAATLGDLRVVVKNVGQATGAAIYKGTFGGKLQFRRLRPVSPVQAVVEGDEIRLSLDPVTTMSRSEITAALGGKVATGATLEVLADGAGFVRMIAAERTNLATVTTALDGKVATGATLDVLADGAGFVRMIAAERTNLATVTTALGGKLALAGGTMTGDLVLAGAPDADLKAATKKYVDDTVRAAASLGVPTSRIAPHIALVIANDATNAAYQLDITADRVSVYDGASSVRHIDAVALTVDMTVAGAGGLDTGAEANSTWYYIHVIAPDVGAAAAILSLSASAPTKPTGYTHAGLVGAIYNDGGGNFILIRQTGTMVARANQTIVSAGTSETPAPVALQVPPIARAASGYMSGVHSTINLKFTKIGPEATLTLGYTLHGGHQSSTGFNRFSAWRSAILTAQTIWYSISTGGAYTTNIYLTSWEY